MGRAPCCDKANVKKGPWSPEEDAKLKDYIQQFGTGGNWIALPQKAGLKRCGKSCRLRWLNYLRPNIKHGEFSDDEDRIICSLYASIGSRWSIIAGQLPGRTDNDIKNYWNTKLKKKLMMGNIISTPNNNSIINQKKSLLNHHQYHHNPHSMIQPYNQYPSSLLSSPSSLLSHVLSASPSPSPSYQCTTTNTVYNNNNSPMTMSFTEGCFNNNNNNTLIPMQNQQLVKDNSTLIVFGDQLVQQQPSSCSSDGSCSSTQMKIDHHHHHHQNNNNNYGVHHQVNHHHPIRRRREDCERRSDDDHHNVEAEAASTSGRQQHNIDELLVDHQKTLSCGVSDNSVGLWGQNSHSALLDYSLEEIKQLISSNYYDETKVEEEKDTKVMYYYNY